MENLIWIVTDVWRHAPLQLVFEPTNILYMTYSQVITSRLWGCDRVSVHTSSSGCCWAAPRFTSLMSPFSLQWPVGLCSTFELSEENHELISPFHVCSCFWSFMCWIIPWCCSGGEWDDNSLPLEWSRKFHLRSSSQLIKTSDIAWMKHTIYTHTNIVCVIMETDAIATVAGWWEVFLSLTVSQQSVMSWIGFEQREEISNQCWDAEMRLILIVCDTWLDVHFSCCSSWDKSFCGWEKIPKLISNWEFNFSSANVARRGNKEPLKNP